MKYSFFLVLFLVKAFPVMGALTEADIIGWEKRASSASPPISAPPIPRKLWTLSDAQNWMTSPPVKKVWADFFKVLQKIPTPDYVRKGRIVLCLDGSVKITSEEPSIPICWYKGATVSSGKIFITHGGLIRAALNDNTLLQGLREASNSDFLPLIRTLE